MKKQCISKGWQFRAEGNEAVVVDLPHDYSIKSKRNPANPGGASNGFFGGGTGSYTKYFDGFSAPHTILDVDGAYMCARVQLNEHQLIMHPYGYTPFLVDLTSKASREASNKIEITTQNLQPSTRWYSGAGLYRDVFLWTGGQVRIEPWDMFIRTEQLDGQDATLSVDMDITADKEALVTARTWIKDSTGSVIVFSEEELKVQEGKNTLQRNYFMTKANVWTPDTPYLYTYEVKLLMDGVVEDTHIQEFGIRTITANAQQGLLLNGVPIKLKGVCIHHDHGALGAASFPAAEYRRLKKLKDAGYNAIRTAHYPPSLVLLEVCDRLGLLVMDEAFDMWNRPKNQLDYSLWFADWWKRDIQSMVLRDRNHPCVISYSIGNEIEERDCTSDGAVWAKTLSDAIRSYDPTRLVTVGICNFWEKPDPNAPDDYQNGNKGIAALDEASMEYWSNITAPYMEPLDMVGYNYLYERYEHDHELYPERLIWGSETHALNFYYSWKKVMEHTYVLGDFTWTAYDNLGEAGTGRSLWEKEGVIEGISLAEYPWRMCYQGDFDLCGYP